MAVRMPLPVDPRLVALFGSATRVRTLASLAGAPGPLTAYRVAQIAGVQRTKVYAELRRLAAAGMVQQRPSGAGRSEWNLINPDVRSLLRRRARVVRSEDLEAEAGELARSARRILAKYARDPINAGLLGDRSRVRNPKDFERPIEKDRILASLGLRVSGHTRHRR
jgi:hypothetical protein